MTEHWLVLVDPSERTEGFNDYATYYKSYEKAEINAKKKASKNQQNYLIFKVFATAKAVVPEIEVVKH